MTTQIKPASPKVTHVWIGEYTATVRCGECGGTFDTPYAISRCPHCLAHVLVTMAAEPIDRRNDGTYPDASYPIGDAR